MRLYDKTAGRSVLRKGAKGNVLEVYEDKPMDFDAWDIDIYYMQKMEEMRICEPVRVVGQNMFKIALRFTYRYRRSHLVQDMVLYRDSRRIDFKTRVDWHEDHRLLKAAFYTISAPRRRLTTRNLGMWSGRPTGIPAGTGRGLKSVVINGRTCQRQVTASVS